MTTQTKILGDFAEAPQAVRWRAVARRNRTADGSFVYAVRSTKIYCRPSCPSKRPQRSRVLFFDTPRRAELAGFRACKRCRPEAAFPQQEMAVIVKRMCSKIEETITAEPDARITLSELGHWFGLSPFQIERAFRKVLRVTPRQFTDALRMSSLKSRLRRGEKLVSAIYESGFGSSSRLYERAPLQMGMTPAVYQDGGKGMEIQYTISPCAMGRVLVAATGRGVSAVYLGDSDAEMEKALRREYPRAEIRRDAGNIGPWVQKIVQHLRGEEPQGDLPLDIRATAFQRRVWEELRRIPWGSTKTYSEVARAIGRPRAVRAVARACATNPVSVIVPCHRVVRRDGSLAGYRWGLKRKTALLEKEKQTIASRS